MVGAPALRSRLYKKYYLSKSRLQQTHPETHCIRSLFIHPFALQICFLLTTPYILSTLPITPNINVGGYTTHMKPYHGFIEGWVTSLFHKFCWKYAWYSFQLGELLLKSAYLTWGETVHNALHAIKDTADMFVRYSIHRHEMPISAAFERSHVYEGPTPWHCLLSNEVVIRLNNTVW